MFVALLVAIVVAIPAGAWAVSFTNVAITDPGGVNRAKVSAGGALSTTVTGTASPAAPANLVRLYAYAVDQCHQAYVVPAGKALILTAATIFVRPSASAQVGEVDLVRGTAGSCAETVGIGLTDPNQSNLGYATSQIDFGAGLAIKAGSTLSTAASNGDGLLMVRGYLVPASQVPASATQSAPATSDGKPALATR
jgi:hypothetical protein